MSTTTRCKFKLSKISQFEGSDNVEMIFYPQYDTTIPEDQVFCKYTPSGEFKMMCNNPAVKERMKLGATYYFDITEVTQ